MWTVAIEYGAADRRGEVDEFEFLTAEWNAAARAVADDYVGRIEAPGDPVRMNIVVTGAPFTSDDLLAYLDTHQGHPFPDEGALEDPDLTVTMGYDVARAIFVEGDEATLGTAFMGGEIKISGDMSRLMFLFDLELSEEQQSLSEEFGARIRDITS
jgi:hypothetical protein